MPGQEENENVNMNQTQFHQDPNEINSVTDVQPYQNVNLNTVNRKHYKPPLSHMNKDNSQGSLHASAIQLGRRNGPHDSTDAKSRRNQMSDRSASVQQRNKKGENIIVSLDPIDVKVESTMVDLIELEREDKTYKVHKYKEAVYLGTMNDFEQRHGLGVMKYINGRQYEGHW